MNQSINNKINKDVSLMDWIYRRPMFRVYMVTVLKFFSYDGLKLPELISMENPSIGLHSIAAINECQRTYLFLALSLN